MLTDTDEMFIRERLGLGAQDRLEVVAEDRPRPSLIQAGKGAEAWCLESGASAPEPASLVSELLAQPDFTDVETLNEELPVGQVKRWNGDPKAVLLEGIPWIASSRGQVVQTEELGGIVLDARWGTAMAGIPLLEGELLLVCQNNCNVGFFRRLPSGVDELARKWETLVFSGPPDVAVPTPEALLQGVEPEAWLLERARELYESPAFPDRLAAVGFIARLSAGTTTRLSELFDQIIADPQQNPAARAREWVRGLAATPAVFEELERFVLHHAATLRRDLLHLDDVVAAGGEAAQLAVRAVCFQRDELESAAWVLRTGGQGELGDQALATLDEEAADHLSALALAADPDDELLATVAWQEPPAWWGRP